MKYERDSSDLAKAIRNYSPVGYQVGVRGAGRGVITEVLQEYKTTTIYRVQLDVPQPFIEFADDRNASDEKLSPEEFRAHYRQMANYFPDELIERGLSHRDILRWEMENSRCLDSDGNVACLTVDWEYVDIVGFKRGMLVEYGELLTGQTAGEGTGGRRVWPGRVVGTIPAGENPEGDRWPIALLELFELTSYYRAPQSINDLAVRPGYYSSVVSVIGYGLYEGIEDNSKKIDKKFLKKLLRGKWIGEKFTDDNDVSHEGEEYALEQPMDVSVIRGFCGEFYPNAQKCFLQALTFYVVPLNVGEEGSWKPLRRTRLEEYESTALVEMDIDPWIKESAQDLSPKGDQE